MKCHHLHTVLYHPWNIHGTSIDVESFRTYVFIRPPGFIRCAEPQSPKGVWRRGTWGGTILDVRDCEAELLTRSEGFLLWGCGNAMALASSAMVNVPCHRVTPLASASQDVSCSGGIFSLSLSPSRCFGRNLKLGSGRRGVVVCFTRPLRPVEERFKIQVERNVDQKRKEELNVERWSKWDSDCCAFDHEWKVDEQVYVVKGSVRVTPEDCEDHAYFYAGDLVRFPKWFSATLSFDEEYEQRYRFLAYGDD